MPGALDFGVMRERSAGTVVRNVGRMAARNKLGAFGVALVILILATAIFTPIFQRYSDTQVFQTTNPDFNPTANPLDIAANPTKQLGSPTVFNRWARPLTGAHWLGTD